MFLSVVFDLDGTLLDTLEDLAAAGNAALAGMGLPVHPVESYCRMVGNGVPKLVWRMLPEDCRDDATHARALGRFSEYYRLHMFDRTRPYPGVAEMLRALQDAGIALGLLSNKADAFVREISEKYFFSSFGFVAGLREGLAAKPDPAGLLAAVDALGGGTAGTLYCGDSDVDVYTARGAGVRCCGAAWGFRGEEELRRAGADFVAQGPEAVTELVLSGRP